MGGKREFLSKPTWTGISVLNHGVRRFCPDQTGPQPRRLPSRPPLYYIHLHLALIFLSTLKRYRLAGQKPPSRRFFCGCCVQTPYRPLFGQGLGLDSGNWRVFGQARSAALVALAGGALDRGSPPMPGRLKMAGAGLVACARGLLA